MILIILLYALFAGTFSIGKVLLGYTQPFFLVGTRMSIAGFLLLGYQFLWNKGNINLKKKHLSLYIQIIFFNVYIPYALRFWGLQYMSTSKACLLYNFAPFISYLFSYLLYKEQVTIKKIIGLIIGFFGLLPIMLVCNPTREYTGIYLLPEIAMILSITSSSYGFILIHRLIKYKDHSPMVLNGISMFFGGLLSLGTSAIIETTAKPIVTDIISFIALLSIVIVISNLLCQNLYGNLLKTYSPTMLSFAGFLSPLFAGFYDWLFLGEFIPWYFYVSASSVLAGLAIFYQDELKQIRSDNKGFQPTQKIQ